MPSSLDIQRIVQEVLRRLDTSQPESPIVASSRLVWPHRVVSAQSLEHRLKGVSELVVPATAVITPAAHDELRSQGVAVVRADQDSTLPTVPVAIQGEASGIEDSDATRIDTDRKWRSFLHAAVSRRQTPLAITPQPHRVACLANRDELLRAVAVTDLCHLKDVVDQTRANVLCISAETMATTSLPNLRQQWQQLAASQAAQAGSDRGGIG